MFSGIIEATGTVRSFIPTGKGGARLAIDAGRRTSAKLKKGDSVAVDGICLTVTRKEQSVVWLDVSPETLQRTNLNQRAADARVNLELPVTANAGISGHFVQGHVDGVGRVLDLIWKGEDVRLRIKLPPGLVQYCVEKGSIAINGVSLTIASLKGRILEIALIPYTLKMTNLGELRPDENVNIETDIVGRYVVSTVKKAYHKRS